MVLLCFFMILTLHQIKFVRDQQDGINSKLQAEFLTLEEEITGLGLEVSISLLVVDCPDLILRFWTVHYLLQKYLTSTSDNLVNTDEIPKEVLDSYCPYPELKESLIQAFRSLSERYQSRLQSLQEQLDRTDRSARGHLKFNFAPVLQAFRFVLTLTYTELGL